MRINASSHSEQLPGATRPAAPQFGSNERFILELVKQGGLTLAIILLLWFYRQDWHRLSDQTPQIITLTQSAVSAQEKTAAALDRHTEVWKQVIDELRRMKSKN